MHEKLDETTRNTGLNDRLNFVIGSIREVRDGPAGVDEDFIVQRVDKLGKNGESRRDLYELAEIHHGYREA
jgi:hypothetical protein